MFGLLLLISFVLTFSLLYKDNDITLTLMKSYLLNDKYDRKTIAFVLALFFPFTLTHYLILKKKNKMNLKNLIKSVVVLLIVFILFNTSSFIYNELVGFNNTEIDQTTQYEAKTQERIAFYNKMYNQISNSVEVTIAYKNDSSFINLVNIVMTNQPNNLNAFFGAIKLIDPSANYNQVTQFYQQLISLANSNREGFLQQEIALQDINKEHNNLLLKFPGSFYNMYFKRQKFNYTPILSSIATDVSKTGIDDNYKLKL